MEAYADRRDAGRRLAPAVRAALERVRAPDAPHAAPAPDAPAPPLVLALPRGGVPVAVEVADALDAPLDVLLVRKLGVPGQVELAFGAIATGGALVLNPDVVAAAELDDAAIERVVDAERVELARRERCYRGERPVPAVAGRPVVVVDDGLATGATMRAAVLALRHRGAAPIVAAAPVGSRDACALLAPEADAVVCPLMPERFRAVGAWYAAFDAVPDDEVVSALQRAASAVRRG